MLHVCCGKRNRIDRPASEYADIVGQTAKMLVTVHLLVGSSKTERRDGICAVAGAAPSWCLKVALTQVHAVIVR